MGLVSEEAGLKSTFSNDVLRLEITGPNEEHLSVIDVPGIFKRTTSGLTTKADMEMVEGMVHNYMKNARCIMLAVVPANVDIATQEILEKAEDVDPEGTRTLGVLTKPDLVDKGAEKNVIDLVEGRTHQLILGWHVLRNAGQADLQKPITERQAIGRGFFDQKAPWNGLEKDKVGIESFRVRLQEILADNIRREFPQVGSPARQAPLNSDAYETGENRDHQETESVSAKFAGSWRETSDISGTEPVSDGNCYGIPTAFRRSIIIQLRTHPCI